jgi:serine/threonine protein kinase
MFDRRAFPLALARSVFCQVLLALHYCHHVYEGQWTLIHRDLKPENGEQ